MIRRPPRSTRTDTLFPYTTLCRSALDKKRRFSMSAYTVSRLALDAGVSVHIVRDYLLRGLLRPVACTPGGYGLFADAALQRLCFVRAAFEAGDRKSVV